MAKKSNEVQKIDIGTHPLTIPALQGVFQRIKQVRDIWKFKFWGAEASRERVETIAEQVEQSDARK